MCALIGMMSVPASAAGKGQAAGSSSSTSPSSSSSGKSATTHSSAHSSTAHKGTAKRRRRATRFVPKQKAPTADRITEIQTALSHGGYYQGNPNGKWDSNTVAAMQKFQSANGIDATGKIDAPSLQKLGLGSDIAGVSAPKPRVPAGSTAPAAAAPAAQSSAGPTPSAAITSTPISSSARTLASKNPQQ
jgi:peptidoglycan hydrolase-like protein with peptidoglycan-binding domain